VSRNILDISEEEFIRNQRERFYDKKLEASSNKIAEVAAEAAGAGAIGGMGGEAMGGEMGLGMPAEFGEEMGAPEMEAGPPEAGPPVEEEGGGFEGLLASPPEAGPPGAGKRDEDYMWYRAKKPDIFGRQQTTTDASKGKWYEPVVSDRRGTSGPRKKNMMSMGGHSQGGRRNTHKGYHDFKSLSKGIVSEQESNYKEVEKSIFRVNREVSMLIESLEKKVDEVQAQ